MKNKRLCSRFGLKDTARWWAPARSSSRRRRGSRGSSRVPAPTAAPSPAAPPPSCGPGPTQTWPQSRSSRSSPSPASHRRRRLWRGGGKKTNKETKHNINLCNSSQAKICIKLEGLKYLIKNYSLLTHSSLCYLVCGSQGSTHSTADYYQYTDPLFMKYHLMKFKGLVYYKIMQIMNRAGSNILPVSLKNIFFCSIQGKKVNKEDLLKDFVIDLFHHCLLNLKQWLYQIKFCLCLPFLLIKMLKGSLIRHRRGWKHA